MRRFAWWAKRSVLAAVVLAGLVTVLAPERVLPPVAGHLDVSEPPRPADYALVLNGDPETRPFAAAALWRAGLVKAVVLTRQKVALEAGEVQRGAAPSEHDLTRRILRHRGVPDDAVRVLPGEITGTADEARAAAGLLAAEPAATALVVTNGFHTRRARLAFRRALGGDAGRVAFVGVPRDGLDPAAWWRSPHGCAAYLGEYAKLIYYWLRS